MNPLEPEQDPTIYKTLPNRRPGKRETASLLAAGDMCGRYKVIKTLGAGAMGQVYLADDTALGTRVALKILSDGLPTSSEVRSRLRREARRSAELRGHPHIATLLDFIEVEVRDRRFPVLIMEYVEGTAASAIVAGSPIRPLRAVRWAIQIADAIEYAHDKGILHCDLKPANIQITPEDRPKVLDFGLARTIHDCGENQDIIAGTPLYMAPEQMTHGKVSESSDLYSLGVTLFEFITGRCPFNGATFQDLRREIIATPPPKASTLVPGLPPGIDAIFERALAKDPRQRFESARELSNHLQLVLDETERWSAQRSNVHSNKRRRATDQRSRTQTALAIVGAGLLLVTLLGFLASRAMDAGVGRIDEFRVETPLWWPVWGGMMLVAPALYLALASIGLVLLSVIGNFLLAIHPIRRLWNRAAKVPIGWSRRLFGIPSDVLGEVLMVAQIGVFIFLGWYFYPLISALITFMDPAAPGSLAELRPSNEAANSLLRKALSLDLLVFCTAWYKLLRSGVGTPRAALLGSAAGAVVVALFFFAMPYRVLIHNDLERVQYGSQACYLAARVADDAVIFCPLALPRKLIVSKDKITRPGLTENIFSEFDRAR